MIPEFINTPLDVLGLALFDLLAPLAMKVAMIDGVVDDREKEHIQSYFTNQWGFSEEFVGRGLSFVEAWQDEYDVKTAAKAIATFVRENPDCKAEAVLKDIVSMLEDVMEADGRIDEREEMAIERIERVFAEEMRFSVTRTAAPMSQAAARLANGVGAGFKSMVTSRKSNPQKER